MGGTMRRMKIEYCTEYDTTGRICGYTMAEVDNAGDLLINARQWKRILDKRTIGGDAGVFFRTWRWVWLADNGYKLQILQEGAQDG